jgi:pimeloyl-ACP methyl ester carboxylesterase
MMPLQNSQILHGGIADSRLEVVENAGHMAILERPEIITGLLSRFLDEFPPPA